MNWNLRKKHWFFVYILFTTLLIIYLDLNQTASVRLFYQAGREKSDCNETHAHPRTRGCSTVKNYTKIFESLRNVYGYFKGWKQEGEVPKIPPPTKSHNKSDTSRVLDKQSNEEITKSHSKYSPLIEKKQVQLMKNRISKKLVKPAKKIKSGISITRTPSINTALTTTSPTIKQTTKITTNTTKTTNTQINMLAPLPSKQQTTTTNSKKLTSSIKQITAKTTNTQINMLAPLPSKQQTTTTNSKKLTFSIKKITAKTTNTPNTTAKNMNTTITPILLIATQQSTKKTSTSAKDSTNTQSAVTKRITAKTTSKETQNSTTNILTKSATNSNAIPSSVNNKTIKVKTPRMEIKLKTALNGTTQTTLITTKYRNSSRAKSSKIKIDEEDERMEESRRKKVGINTTFKQDESRPKTQPPTLLNKKKNNGKKIVNCFSQNIEDVRKGVWVQKEGITSKDIKHRIDEDRRIRIAMNWSPELHRTDGKCGENVKLPGYRLFSQCDPYGKNPCCNQMKQQCGHSKEDCECDNCTNFQTMVSAELSSWKPHNCLLKEFLWKDSCSLLHRNNISLYFMGDSLIRQIHTALLLHLTNDYEKGAVPMNVSDVIKKICKGPIQLTKRFCSVESIAQKASELPPGAMCKGMNISLDIEMVQDYYAFLEAKISGKIDSLINRKDAWIIGGVGLHYQLNFKAVRERYLDKVIEKVRKSKNGWPKLIWIENHGVSGYLREVAGPGNRRINKYNKILAKYLKARNIPIIPTFEISEGVHSYDGRHYGIGLNQLKVKLLMNYLQEFYKEKKI